jgi:hypothetical protein
VDSARTKYDRIDSDSDAGSRFWRSSDTFLVEYVMDEMSFGRVKEMEDGCMFR